MKLKIALAVALSVLEILCFLLATGLFMFSDDRKVDAIFYMALAVSMELSAQRAWRRVFGKDAF